MWFQVSLWGGGPKKTSLQVLARTTGMRRLLQRPWSSKNQGTHVILVCHSSASSAVRRIPVEAARGTCVMSQVLVGDPSAFSPVHVASPRGARGIFGLNDEKYSKDGRKVSRSGNKMPTAGLGLGVE